MFTDRFIPRLRRKIAQREEQVRLEMAKGTAKDFAEYKLYVGRLRGLAELQDLISETARELEVEADD